MRTLLPRTAWGNWVDHRPLLSRKYLREAFIHTFDNYVLRGNE